MHSGAGTGYMREGEAPPEGTRASPMAARTSSCVCEATQSPMTCREWSDEADHAEGSQRDAKQQQSARSA